MQVINLIRSGTGPQTSASYRLLDFSACLRYSRLFEDLFFVSGFLTFDNDFNSSNSV